MSEERKRALRAVNKAELTLLVQRFLSEECITAVTAFMAEQRKKAKKGQQQQPRAAL